ncbi:unnamed protein product [Paramecium pentaurelia]|uniref:Transmembrane protein n=1 Tax=Paramecium pentaurelia TaxID=43138 RepID=A0A8S1X5S9_9CILI|nr:unnamed protein product [Paramecium pentaurelia]
MFHSYINYVIRTQASLLYIQSSLSSIYIQQFLGDQNTLTNSSNTFVVISSETLKLLNYTIKYQNWLNKDLWIKYYDLKLDDNNNQEDFNKIIFSTLKLNNQGGAGKLHTSIFFCIDCFFDHILAQEGFLFDITTSGQGVINLVNLTVNYAENNLESTEKYYGCLKIDSSNGQLNLNLKNAIFQYVQNRMATSILTVFPSKIQNLITIENVKIIDCLSLFNQIMNIQFSQLITNKNLVFIKNLTIIQNLQIWNTYFTQIKILSNEELNEIVQNNNALIFMENCNIQLKGLIIEGVFISPIMKFINIPRLQIELLRIQNIIIFYQFTLIHVMQIANIKSIIKFQEIDIQNVSIYEVLEESNIHTNNDKNNTILIHPLRKPSLQNFLNENAKLFQLNSLQFGSIFNFKSLSTQSFFYFDRIKLMKNNCQHCEKGLMYFELEEFQEIRISSLNCIQNQIKQFGCLYFTKNKYDQTKIIVKNSNFLFNQGTQGVAITNINIYFKLISSKIIQNTASELGGGIYFEIDSNTFIVNQSIIISNIAKIGGGIYLKGLSNLNKNNFINSILLFNQALEQGNNVIEIPSHLALFINSKEIPSTSKIINDIQTNQMKLNTYQILEQDQIRQYEELIIPSNQIIKDFQIFDIRQSKYKLFIENMELYYKNSRNELLKTFFNLTCLINQSIIIKSDSYIENQKKNKIVKFNNEKQHFDLSSLQFTLDPYQNYEHLLISIYCKFHDKEKGLMYQIKAKSLKCQLGEFYVNEGCQICQSNQGFYSVTYNTTKCSIFDKTKFSNITSNMIDLLPGYWRPHNLSDFTEECFKNQAYCQGGWLVGYNLCIPGHIGALCEECDIYDIRGFGNFYKNQWNQQCQICQDKWDGIISLILILIWTFLSIILSLRSINRSNKLFTQLKLIRRYHKILFKLNQDHESILIKLMINYLWTFQVIFTFNIKFSLSFYFVEQISNSSYSIASNQDCHLSKISTNPLIYIKLLMMITFIISQFNIIFLASFCYFKKMKHKYDLSILTNTLLYLYIVNYAGLMKMLSSVLSIRVISNINYIQGDVTLQFGDQNHKYWIFYCVLPGLIFFGFLIPVFILVFLLINRNNLDKIKLRKHICYLLNEYESQSYFWEQIKQLKKTIIIFILTHFETQILFKALLLGLCLLIYQILAINQKPFVIKTFNSLDLEAAQICSISIYLTAIKYICEQQNIHYATIILEISIIGLFIRLFYLFMQNIFRIYYKKYKIPILANLCEIFKLIGKNFILTIYLNKILSFHKEKEQRLQNNYLKLRNYLLYFTKIQLRNSKLLTYQNISERIQTVKSSRSDFEKINFLGIGELNDHII